MQRVVTRSMVAVFTLLAMVMIAGPASAAAPADLRPATVAAETTATEKIARPAGVPADARLVAGAMQLECDKLSGDAKKYADAKGYCQISTQDVREGDCGISYLWIWNNDGGYAGMSFGVGSYLGDIMYISSNVAWVNWNYGISGNVGGSGWVWDVSYDRNTEAYTAAGYVTAAYSGTVTLIWGGQCTILIPTDWTDVTW